ncbi:hypothetical protein EV385_0492 [Krasilnikovia cinnamomea]|uniref:Uncharacterized protein n=1 Tax=Krasilnikovia cinnamomea TaxID=349313 RepID=A0A4Q7ZDP3_9ACTN|nr:hypothetical protein EV385_0492 [Krasilnikovia cinnamomea]
MAGTLTALAMLTMALAFSGQLGLGDVALLGVVNLNLAWLSWQAALAGVLIAFMLQGILVLTCKGRTETRATSPMGPAIWAGWLLAVFVS